MKIIERLGREALQEKLYFEKNNFKVFINEYLLIDKAHGNGIYLHIAALNFHYSFVLKNLKTN